MSGDGGGRRGAPRPGSLRAYMVKAESVAVRVALLGVAVVGVVAQFSKPVGDALRDKVFLGGALLSLVAYVLYDAVKGLVGAGERPEVRTRVNSRELGPYVREAFRAREVSIRFIGYTGETLFNEVYHRLEALLEAPRRTRKVTISVLVPDFSVEMAVPSEVGPDGAPLDDREFRERVARSCQDYEQQLQGLAEQFGVDGRVEARFEYRHFRSIPRDKVCILNGDIVLHGLYDVTTRQRHHQLRREIYDPKGFDTNLHIRSRKEGTAEAEETVDHWVKHFDGLWQLARRGAPPLPPTP
ncbi:hypothetical protein OG897_02635 [Streptomyces sp. NBC_00237]|uniref:hypothetical protein n=1 Tax=Streptomyces sp. NBC_00237 TaxID=2975687 RepID=UPI0022572EC4|nr:hypothetical protein [Streptomyces sp. NBC_00237]MCX5200362.1 hypothetical protein [Streptomyces sp. NBC_00237]